MLDLAASDAATTDNALNRGTSGFANIVLCDADGAAFFPLWVFLENTADDKLGRVVGMGIVERAKVTGSPTRGTRLMAHTDGTFKAVSAAGERVVGVVLDDASGGYARILFDGEGGMGTVIL